jgi:outer membrane biosynthesis protein TonB
MVAIRPRVKPAAAPVETDESVIAAIINRGGAPAGFEAEPVTVAPVPLPTPAPAVVAPPEPPPPEPPPTATPEPGPVPTAAPEPEPVDLDPEKKFTLRLPASLLAAIEKDAKGRLDRISVNTWLIGAALQRLGR